MLDDGWSLTYFLSFVPPKACFGTLVRRVQSATFNSSDKLIVNCPFVVSEGHIIMDKAVNIVIN